MINPYDIKIGDMVSPEMALELAKHFNLDYIVNSVEDAYLINYKPFRFDGASCLIDSLASLLAGIDQKLFTYECAMPHDIAYYFGLPGDSEEKEMVDQKFKSDLIEKAGMKSWLAEIFYYAVKFGGVEELGTSFSWGFGRQPNKCFVCSRSKAANPEECLLDCDIKVTKDKE